MTRITAVALALLAFGTTAHADSYRASDRIDHRQDNQQRRIEQGVRSGEINRWEHARLQAEQARIRAIERDAKRDGHVDRHERARIEHAQDRASQHIRHEKHDRDVRGSHHRHSDRSGGWDRRWW